MKKVSIKKFAYTNGIKLYSDSRKNKIIENSDEINEIFEKKKEEIQKKKNEEYHPTLEEKKQMMNLVKNYIIENKLKLYGGHAQNYSIKSINPDKIFYTDPDDLHDYDIYSTDPINDGIKITNLLYEQGYKNVRFIEALHIETYSIKCEDFTICDLTYVPTIIFNSIPFIQVDKFNVTSPIFYTIDFLRMFVDPISSAFRWDKHYERFNKIQEVFPIKEFINEIDFNKFIYQKVPKTYSKEIKKIILSLNTVFITGIHAFNKYYSLNKDNLIKYQYIKKIPEYKFELISTDYINDTKTFIKELKKAFPKKTIRYEEYYKFFQFLDNSTIIYIDDIPVIHIYNYNNICLPYVKISKYNYCSFQYNLMFIMVQAIYKRVYNKFRLEGKKNHDEENELYKLVSHMTILRMNYLNFTNKTEFDPSPFEDFIIQCKGSVLTPNEIKTQEPGYKGFKYVPENKFMTEMHKVYRNLSGGIINNEKHLQIKDI